MATTVITEGEISLNSVFYRLAERQGGIRQVQSTLASIYAAKVVIGDTTRDSQQRASVLSLSDNTGGIGVERMQGAAEVDRVWWSTAELRFKEHVTLPPLTVLTASPATSGAIVLGELASEVYAALSTVVYKYDNTNDTWGSALDTMPAPATDVVTGRLDGTVYMIFATTGGYTYTTDGSTFTDDTTDTKYLAFWDDRLWGIDNTGQLWFALTIGTETNDAKLQLPDGSVKDLFVARDSNGQPVLYAATQTGLWVHDAGNARFIETELQVPFPANAGQGTAKWRDSIYFPAGMGVYKYVNAGNAATVSLVGLDRDDGVPEDKRGEIRQFVQSLNELFALVDATTSEIGALNNFDDMAAEVIEAGSGFSYIAGFNEIGWAVKWLGGQTAKAIEYGLVSNAYSLYRLWWGQNGRIYFMKLPSDVINPRQITDWAYGPVAEHITPWFTAGQKEVDKLALQLKIDATNMSSSSTAVISFATDYSETYTILNEITSDGITTFTFPNTTTPTGTAFRAIRFKIDLQRGSTNTDTPDIVNITLVYRKKLPAKWGHMAELDLAQDYKGLTPLQLRATLLTAIESTSLIEFTFRDDDGLTRNYYIDVIQVTGLENTGRNEGGTTRVFVAEP